MSEQVTVTISGEERDKLLPGAQAELRAAMDMLKHAAVPGEAELAERRLVRATDLVLDLVESAEDAAGSCLLRRLTGHDLAFLLRDLQAEAEGAIAEIDSVASGRRARRYADEDAAVIESCGAILARVAA